jgi:predicted enzyme related to lactoylglutathione lyase
MKLEHMALNVEDPVGMAKWYADNLEMRIVRAVDESPYFHFVADKQGQSMLELYNNPTVEVPDYASLSPFVLHIAFAVDDIERTRDRLVAAGATIAGNMTTMPTGDQLLFLRDPWNVPFQLVKRVKPLI